MRYGQRINLRKQLMPGAGYKHLYYVNTFHYLIRRLFFGDNYIMHKLFLLKSSFVDKQGVLPKQLYYCPSCAMIEGILTYYPDLKKQLKIHYVEFERPRRMIIELLGEENQGCPLLIGDESNTGNDIIPFNNYGSYRFINNVNHIVQFLSLKYDRALPHF
jgi:hypothetical protein